MRRRSGQARAPARGGSNLERAPERGDPVSEALQPVSPWVGMPDPAVGDDDMHQISAGRHCDDCLVGACVLDDVGHCLGDDEPGSVLDCDWESLVDDFDNFVFRVKTDGKGVKSPMDMFEEGEIENDLKLINDKINAYYKGGK